MLIFMLSTKYKLEHLINVYALHHIIKTQLMDCPLDHLLKLNRLNYLIRLFYLDSPMEVIYLQCLVSTKALLPDFNQRF